MIKYIIIYACVFVSPCFVVWIHKCVCFFVCTYLGGETHTHTHYKCGRVDAVWMAKTRENSKWVIWYGMVWDHNLLRTKILVIFIDNNEN